ncbi:unnamed protein product, partial [Medioppia subpectinata]
QYKQYTHQCSFSATVFHDIKRHLNEDLRQLYDMYGPVVTVWVGPKPVVIVGDPHVIKQAFSRPEFMGRMDNMLLNTQKQ